VGSLITDGLIVGAIFGCIGALIFALIHGLGYRVAGVAQYKPRFFMRFLVQLATVLVSGAILYGVTTVASESGTVLAILNRGVSSIFFLVIGMGVGSYYLGLSLVTFLLPITTQQFGVAARAAVLPSVVVLLLYLLPVIAGLSTM
jgi:hypothetical protein